MAKVIYIYRFSPNRVQTVHSCISYINTVLVNVCFIVCFVAPCFALIGRSVSTTESEKKLCQIVGLLYDI